MRYFLPPPGPSRPRRQIPRLEPLAAVESSTDPRLQLDVPSSDSGRLVRVVELDPGSSADYLERWADDPPTADPISSRPGVRAVERRRPDVGPGIAAGSQSVRRQRLAVAEVEGKALAAHWSVPEPATDADFRAWNRLLDRLEREVSGHRSWTA